MAQSIPRPCSYPGCPNIVQGYKVYRCPDHPYQRDLDQQRQYDNKRGNASSRGYDSTWRKLRDAHLATHPMCVPCLSNGKVTLATMVDHHHELSDGGSRLDPNNLTSMCYRCHSLKTKQVARERAVKGQPYESRS